MTDLSPALTTIPNITLIETGTWLASTGEVTFTEQDLRAAAEAPLTNPEIKMPRLRFGHTAPGTSILESQGYMDSQPVVGKFINMRVEEDGTKLVADLVGVPVWLAEILPVAYPTRSVEAYFEVTTPNNGKYHKMIVTSVAVLGEEQPGVATLEDLQLLFSEQGPDWVQELEFEGDAVAASRGGRMPEQRVAASVDTSDIRSAFYEQVAVDDRYWWWVHQLYIDPSVIIADDEGGDFWLVPYSASASGVTFEDPVQVYIQWVETESGDVRANAKTVKIPEEFGKPKDSWATAKLSRPPERQTEWENKNNPQKEAKAAVAIDIDKLRTALGVDTTVLPDDATEEQINEALAAQAESGDGTNTEVEETEETEETPEVETTETPESEAKASGAVVDKTVLKELKEDLEARKAKERTDVVKAAIDDGRVPPSRKAHYLSLMERDPEGTAAFLETLEKDTVPVKERGHGEDSAEATKAGAAGTGLFPKLDAARAERAGV